MGIYALAYFFIPKIIKRKLSKTLGQIHFWVTTIGLIILIGSSQYLGFPGIPNRYYEFDAFDTQLDVGWMNEFFIFVIIIMILAQLIFFINLIYSLTKPITKE